MAIIKSLYKKLLIILISLFLQNRRRVKIWHSRLKVMHIASSLGDFSAEQTLDKDALSVLSDWTR